MSWITRIQDKVLEITTGDGKVYTPIWRDAEKAIEYNTEGFDFIGIQGTYVERKEVRGTQYSVLFYFQGDDCIEVSKQFEISARDKRPWKINHPFYDTIAVQPLNLTFDNKEYNITRITGTLWETISKKFPEQIVNVAKQGDQRKRDTDTLTESKYSESKPSAASIDSLGTTADTIGKNYDNLATTAAEQKDLKDRIRLASGAAQTALSNASGYIRKAINLINFPFSVKQNIDQKFDAMILNIQDLASIFLSGAPSLESIFNYEIQAITNFTELSRNLLSVTPSNFQTRRSVLRLIDTLDSTYSTYLTNLDDLSYTADAQLSFQLDILINSALANLSNVAFDSKQERTVFIDKDSNIITLAHQYFGSGDDALDEFVLQNNIGLKEFLGLKKGREIIYFV